MTWLLSPARSCIPGGFFLACSSTDEMLNIPVYLKMELRMLKVACLEHMQAYMQVGSEINEAGAFYGRAHQYGQVHIVIVFT